MKAKVWYMSWGRSWNEWNENPIDARIGSSSLHRTSARSSHHPSRLEIQDQTIHGAQHTSWSRVHLSTPHPELRSYQVWSWRPPCPTSKEPIGINSNPSLMSPFVPIEFEFQHLTVTKDKPCSAVTESKKKGSKPPALAPDQGCIDPIGAYVSMHPCQGSSRVSPFGSLYCSFAPFCLCSCLLIKHPWLVQKGVLVQCLSSAWSLRISSVPAGHYLLSALVFE